MTVSRSTLQQTREAVQRGLHVRHRGQRKGGAHVGAGLVRRAEGAAGQHEDLGVDRAAHDQLLGVGLAEQAHPQAFRHVHGV